MRVRVGAAEVVDEQRVAHGGVRGAFGAVDDLDQAAVRGAPAAARDRLGDDRGAGVRGEMDHLRAGVLILALAGEAEGHGRRGGVRLGEDAGRVLHRSLGPDVAVDPFHRAALAHVGALGDEVVHVVRPVLHGGVAHAGVLLDDDLDDGRVQRVLGPDRGGAALDVVHVGALVRNDQRALELAHGRRVDAEVGLQRDVDVHALRHVHERAAGPRGGVERAELVVLRGDDGAEVLAHQIGVFAHGGVGVDEDHALIGEILLDGVVDDLGLVLGGHAGDEAALLRLGDAQAVIGVADVVGQFLPRLGLLLDRLDVVFEVVGVEAAEVHAPIGHRLVQERLEPAQAHVEHPLRLALVGADGAHDVLVDASLRRLAGGIGIVPSVAVVAELLDDLVILFDFLLVDAGAISHVLAHLHVSRGIWRLVFAHRTLPPIN